MNNKPAAWMYKDEEGGMVSFIKDTLPFDAVPLYTHPADLADEEWVATYMTWCMTSNDPLVLKQAILRKAQEK